MLANNTIDHANVTYIYFNARSFKLENSGVEVKLSIQREFDVFCFPKAMLFTFAEKIIPSVLSRVKICLLFGLETQVFS